jgi:hypothetical protein
VTGLDDVVREPLTKDDITKALEVQRRQLLDKIAKNQALRSGANEVIADAREQLADVERMLAATKPRTRKRKASTDG